MTANLTAFPVISNIITFYYIYYSVLFSMVPCDSYSYTMTLQSAGRIFRAQAVKFKPQ